MARQVNRDATVLDRQAGQLFFPVGQVAGKAVNEDDHGIGSAAVDQIQFDIGHGVFLEENVFDLLLCAAASVA